MLGELESEAPSIRENKSISLANVRLALSIVEANRDKMIAKWHEHLG